MTSSHMSLRLYPRVYCANNLSGSTIDGVVVMEAGSLHDQVIFGLFYLDDNISLERTYQNFREGKYVINDLLNSIDSALSLVIPNTCESRIASFFLDIDYLYQGLVHDGDRFIPFHTGRGFLQALLRDRISTVRCVQRSALVAGFFLDGQRPSLSDQYEGRCSNNIIHIDKFAR